MAKGTTQKLSFNQRVLKQARVFLRLGLFVIAILAGTKRPRVRKWPELRLEIADLDEAFGPGDGIACLLGKASRGLVDIDLDCDEAIAAATFFLPPTERIHGRKSKRSSHWWYFVNPAPSPIKFVDVDGTTLLEQRSTGQFTVIPPSIHPSGENFYWQKTGDPAEVPAAELLQAARRLAACALVARHWPAKGSRHELTLALAGFLLRGGWSVNEVKHFVTTAAFASMGDDEWRLRKNNVQSTLNRLTKGLPVTGIPRLASLVGDDVVAKLIDWLELSPSMPGVHQTITVTWPAQPKASAFRGLAGEFVSIVSPHSESDPVALLSQFLVAFGSAIGRKPHFLVEADKHCANLFVVLVGPTSKARKGSALSQVKRLFEEADAHWANNCVQSGLSSGEGLIWAVRDSIFSKDGEKFLDIGVDDKRLLAVESEIAQQLKLMAREGNILSTVIRQSWDSGNLRTLTKNNPAQATGAHISIIGHISQQELRRYLNETELGNGFANRFLWLCVKRSKVLPEGGKLTDADLQELVGELRTTIQWARKIKKVQRSKKARKLWAKVYPELSEGRAGLLGAVTSRAEAQVTRLALIYALLDRSSVILIQHLKAALAFWEYAEASARFIFGDSLGDPIADEILQALRVNPAGLTRTDISNLFSGHRKSTDIGRALLVLAQSGLASYQPEITGGRPDERWFVLTKDAKNAKKE